MKNITNTTRFRHKNPSRFNLIALFLYQIFNYFENKYNDVIFDYKIALNIYF